MSTANDAAPTIKLPKFLVSTVEPKSRDGDRVVFNRYSKQTGELPLLLVEVSRAVHTRVGQRHRGVFKVVFVAKVWFIENELRHPQSRHAPHTAAVTNDIL